MTEVVTIFCILLKLLKMIAFTVHDKYNDRLGMVRAKNAHKPTHGRIDITLPVTRSKVNGLNAKVALLFFI